MALSVNDFTAGTVITASAMNANFATIENYVNTSPGLATLTGATFSGLVTANGGITATGTTGVATFTASGTATIGGVVDITDTTDSSDATGDTGALRCEGGASIAKKLYVGSDLDVNGTITVGVDDTGHNVKFFGAESGAFLLWDQAEDDLELWGNAKINLTNTTAGSSNFQINFKEGYDIYADNTGTGSDNTRLWFGGPVGGTFYIGPRAGGAELHSIDLRADTVNATSDLSVTGALSKGSGSFDIPHPTKGGDWRLRHSFIEGPKADNIYRGTVTLSKDPTLIDLDEVSNMVDGTWEALNTNPWSMVASSGNEITWSLSGKTLSVSGPNGAVCNWMVIGERKDQVIIDSSITDDNGKMITEYEKPVVVIDAS